MEYSIREIAELTGVSSRTLRYYDSIGLLRPARVNEAGYRFYGRQELLLLQQILFYRERGFALETISQILYQKDFDISAALEEHLRELQRRRRELSNMIETVQKTIAERNGGQAMQDKERFEAFKRRIAAENQAAYGREARMAYGDAQVDAAASRLLEMTQADYERFQNLKDDIQKALEAAVLNGEKPESEAGRQIALLHQQWLGMSWAEYTENAHRNIAQLYVLDGRFRAYYDRNVTGCAEFLRNAVLHWIEKTAVS